MAKRSSRKQGRIDLYEVASGLYQLQEGFRLYWFVLSHWSGTNRDETPPAAVSISCRRGFVSIGSAPVRKHVGIGMSERKRLPQRWISCGHWPIPCAKENPRRNKPFASKPKRSWLASRVEAGSKSILPRWRWKNSDR